MAQLHRLYIFVSYLGCHVIHLHVNKNWVPTCEQREGTRSPTPTCWTIRRHGEPDTDVLNSRKVQQSHHPQVERHWWAQCSERHKSMASPTSKSWMTRECRTQLPACWSSTWIFNHGCPMTRQQKVEYWSSPAQLCTMFLNCADYVHSKSWAKAKMHLQIPHEWVFSICYPYFSSLY